MSNKYFENKIKAFLNINPDIEDLLTRGNKSINNHSYEYLLEEALYRFGVISINIYGPSDIYKRYFPYIKYNKNNIFNEPEGLDYLSNRFPLTEKQAGEKMADYLIGKLTFKKDKLFK